MVGAQRTTLAAAASTKIDTLDTFVSCHHFGGRERVRIVTPLTEMETTPELLEDYDAMCGFVGPLDFTAFCAGYWAHATWIEEYDMLALPLAS
jgi:hypothetical protein